MVMRTGPFSDLVAPGLRKVFFQEFDLIPLEYTRVLNVLPSSRAYEEDVKVSGLSTMPEKTEGSATTYVDPAISGKVKYTHKPFGLGFRVTHEMHVDDLYGPARKMAKALARSARHRAETQAWAPWNDAFSGSTYTGFDGLSLCSTAHTLLLGGTYANRPATETDFSVTALQAALSSMEMCVDDSNMVIGMKGRLVVGHPSNKWVFKEVLKSEYRPYSANNEINSILDEGLDYFLCHYQSDSDAWGVFSAQGIHDINVFIREALRMENADDFDSGDAKFKAYQRLISGFGEWRGVYGSSGI